MASETTNTANVETIAKKLELFDEVRGAFLLGLDQAMSRSKYAPNPNMVLVNIIKSNKLLQYEVNPMKQTDAKVKK